MRVPAPDPDFKTLVQGPSARRRRRKGDVVAELLRGGWLATRIAEDDAVVGGMERMYVLYIFQKLLHSPDQACDAAQGPEELRLPPLIVNRACWTAGFLQFAASYEDCPGVIWDGHVFEHSFSGRYLDAHNRDVPPAQVAQAPLIGVCKVHNALGLDVMIGRALRAAGRL